MALHAPVGELAMELDRIVSDEEHQHTITSALLDGAQHCVEVRRPKLHELHADDLDVVALLQEPLDERSGATRPNVVVTDHEPAPHTELLGHPPECGAELDLRRLADSEHPRCRFSALVQRGVDVGDPAPRTRGELLPHCREVPAHNSVNLPAGDQPFDLRSNPIRPRPAVDKSELHRLGEDAARVVDLLARQT